MSVSTPMRIGLSAARARRGNAAAAATPAPSNARRLMDACMTFSLLSAVAVADCRRVRRPAPRLRQTPQGRGQMRADRCRRGNPEARRRDHAVLLSHHVGDRDRRGRRPASDHLPAGARRRRHGGRLCPRHQRPPARRVRDAVRAGRGERVPRHRHDVLRFGAGAVPAARSCARAGAGVSDVPFQPHLCLGHQAGRAHPRAGTGAGGDASRVQPVEERAAGTGDGGTAARSAGARHRQRRRWTTRPVRPTRAIARRRTMWRRRRACWSMRRVR